MAYMPGHMSKDVKELLAKKSQYYVEFLGWMECRGLRGQIHTEPVIRELRRRQRKVKDTPPKLTIQVSKKELKISQEVEDRRKHIKKIKFPSIPGRDITFIQQALRPGDGRPDDIVACIYLGYMPRTGRYVHVHVYRFDSAGTASAFAAHMSAIAGSNHEHIVEVERTLAAKGEIDDITVRPVGSESRRVVAADSAVGSASSGYSGDDDVISEDDIDGDAGMFTSSSRKLDPDVQSLHEVKPYADVTDELRKRMNIHEKPPLLLPPKDYDTISRAQGNVIQASERRCLNLSIVGDLALQKERNGSNESGVDLASPSRDSVEVGEAAGKSEPGTPDVAAPGQTESSSLATLHKPPLDKDGSSEGDTNSQGSLGSSHRSPGSAAAHRSGHNSTGSSLYADTPPPLATHHDDMIYPPKMSPSPTVGPSQPMWPGPNHNLARHIMERQNSDGSGSSSHRSLPHYAPNSDAGRRPIPHISAGPDDDVYALPMKHSGYPGRLPEDVEDVPPADYGEDDDVALRRAGNRPQQARMGGLTRSMPGNLIRSEMSLLRPNSPSALARPLSGGADIPPHLYRRTDSPTFVGFRSESPAGMNAYPHHFRSDSPLLLDARSSAEIAGGGRNSPRMLRVSAGKR